MGREGSRRRGRWPAAALGALAVASFALAAGAMAAACSGTAAPQGGLMLVLRTDGSLPEATRLHITVSSSDGSKVFMNRDYAIPSEATLPTTLGIGTNDNPTASVWINGSLWAGSALLDDRINHVFQIPKGRVAELDIVFSAACTPRAVVADGNAGSSCPSGETCDPKTGGCTSVSVAATQLPTFAGGEGPSPDGGDGPIPGVPGSPPGGADGPSCPQSCTVGASFCTSATSLERCQAATSACPAFVVEACAPDSGPAPYVCERYGAPSCVDPAWAEWPMPNSPGDVGDAGAPNPPSYVDNGDGTVTDNVTGLMWQRATAPSPDGGPYGSYSQPDALAYCAGLTLAGHHDWRLPSLIELISIVDYSVVGPAINTAYFPDTPPLSFFWSATSVASSSADAWYVYFGDGSNIYHSKADTNAVRCVR